MKPSAVAAYVLCAAACIFLGRYELHTDDAGVEAFGILLITFALGALHPVRAWQWALLVGPAIPAADLLFGRGPQRPADLALLAGFVILLGLAGSYAGAWIRRPRRPARPSPLRPPAAR